jgi:hypothetical protein
MAHSRAPRSRRPTYVCHAASTNMPQIKPYVFISYVRDDAHLVDRLSEALRSAGVNVWLDKENISPGLRWKDAIRRAIHDGAFFVACFSEASGSRTRSYMNEELLEALEILRQSSRQTSWFIPVKLSECEIPDITIWAGESLRDLQYVDMAVDWPRGFAELLAVVRPHAPTLSQHLSVIIPMFNEEGVIGPTLTELVKKNSPNATE